MIIISSLLIILLSFFLMSKVISHIFIKVLDSISAKVKLSPSIEGATLMAIGTSVPELSTALIAFLLPGMNILIGLGAVVGSALFETLIVIGISCISHTIQIDWKAVLRDIFFNAVAIILLIIIIEDGSFSIFESGIMVFTYIFYLFVMRYWAGHIREKKHRVHFNFTENNIKKGKVHWGLFKILSIIFLPVDYLLKKLPDPQKKSKWIIPLFILSLILISILSFLVVTSSENLALSLGVPSVIIALTVTAMGGALPELISSIIVVKENRGEIAVSNTLGSNIFNILIGLGLPLLIFNIIYGTFEHTGHENITASIFLLFAVLFTILLLLAIQHFKIHKWFGIVLILLYFLYVAGAYLGFI